MRNYLIALLTGITMLVNAQIGSFKFENNLDNEIEGGFQFGSNADSLFSTSNKCVDSYSVDLSYNTTFKKITSTDSVDLGNDFTISFYIKKFGTTGTRVIFSNQPTSSTLPGFTIWYNYSTGVLEFKSRNASTSLGAYSTSGLHTSGACAHFTFVIRKAEGICRIYKDGVDVTSADSLIHTDFASKAPLILGGFSTAGYESNAFFDNLQVHDCALSADSVNSVYQNPNRIVGCEAASVDSYLTVTPNSQSVERGSGSISYTVSSNITWSALSDGSWTEAVKQSPTSLQVNYSSNNTSLIRVDTIRVYGALVDTVKVVLRQDSLEYTPPIPQGQLSHFKFNGNLTDELDNITLIPDGTAVFNSTTNKCAGTHALDFASTSFRRVKTSASVDLGSEFTIAFWMKKFSTSAQMTPISNQNTSGADGFFVWVDASTGVVQFVSRNGGVNNSSFSQTGTYVSGSCLHLAFSVNKNTGVCKIYKNGVDVTTADSLIHTTFNTDAIITVGSSGTNTYNMSGCIDDLQLYTCALPSHLISDIHDTPETLVTCSSDEVNYIFVNPTHLLVAPSEGTATVSVQSNIVWEVNTSAAWLDVLKLNSASFRITYFINQTGSSRVDTIYITSSELATQKVIITQSTVGKVATIPYLRGVPLYFYRHIAGTATPPGEDPTPPPAPDNSIFNLYFAQDFQDNTIGPYNLDEWKADWNNPGSSDPRPYYPNWDYAIDHYTIKATDGTNKYFERRIPQGEWSTGPWLGMGWNIPIGSHEELYFSYKIRFSNAFFNQGKYIDGKLPGLYDPWSGTAGAKPSIDDGFTARLMFRNNQAGQGFGVYEIFGYIYWQDMLHNSCNTTLCPGYSVSNCPDNCKLYYGNHRSVNFTPQPNIWYNITIRMSMNTPGSYNGIYEVFVNGQLVASHTNFRWRNTAGAVTVKQLRVHNFLGGGEASKAATDMLFDFDDFVAFTFKSNYVITRGTTPSNPNILLPLPILPK